jgi:hypothetical protein
MRVLGVALGVGLGISGLVRLRTALVARRRAVLAPREIEHALRVVIRGRVALALFYLLAGSAVGLASVGVTSGVLSLALVVVSGIALVSSLAGLRFARDSQIRDYIGRRMSR